LTPLKYLTDSCQSESRNWLHCGRDSTVQMASLRYLFAFRSSNSSRTFYAHRRNLANHAYDARSDQTFRIPLIDLSKYRHANSLSEKRKTAEEIVYGFKEVGFIYLKGHGIPSSTVDNVFKKSTDFFRLPSSIKDKLAWDDPQSNRGYIRVGRERSARSIDVTPDTKETMEIGRDWDETWRNHWPQESDAPGFKQTMVDFYKTCHETHCIVMRAIALGLGLDEMFFEDKINEQRHNLRLLSYPPIKTSSKEDHSRFSAHSDYGTLTLVFQDNVGGLEVQNPHTKHFQPVKPIVRLVRHPIKCPTRPHFFFFNSPERSS